MMDLKKFSTDLLDDTTPLKSYVEDAMPETFTPQVSAACMMGA